MSDFTPRRIQQKRTKGWRMPLFTKSVARPSKWGNPFRIARVDCNQAGMCWTVSDGHDLTIKHIDNELSARQRAVELYSIHIGPMGCYEIDTGSLDELAGLSLACWCPLPEPGEPDWCHAAVLLDLASS